MIWGLYDRAAIGMSFLLVCLFLWGKLLPRFRFGMYGLSYIVMYLFSAVSWLRHNWFNLANQSFCEAEFHGFRSNFGVENRPKNVPVGEKRISWKTLFLLSKITVFQSGSPPKIIEFAPRNEDVKQSAPKLEISPIFGGSSNWIVFRSIFKVKSARKSI